MLNLGHTVWLTLHSLTGESHFLSFDGTGLFFPVQSHSASLTIMCWRSVCCERCCTVADMKAGVRTGLLDRAAATCILMLCLGCLHVIALKPQLFTRHGGVSYSTGTPISYKTFYFDQKVSLKISRIFLIILCKTVFYTYVFHWLHVSLLFFLFHFTFKCFN